MPTVRNVHVGTPVAGFPLEDSVLVHFHDFENLTETKSEAVESPIFVCAGHEWFLKIYPGEDSNSNSGMVAVYLCTKLKSKIVAEYDIILRTGSSEVFRSYKAEEKSFPVQGFMGWGWSDYVEREMIMDPGNGLLNMGTLTFEVRITPHSNNHFHEVKPRSTLSDSMFNLFLNKDSVDVSFEVGSQLFSAHRVILKARAPQFAELTESCDLTKPMPINDVDPKVFQTMLHCLYDKEISDDIWKQHSKQILDASGKYGFGALKLEAEGWYIKNLKLEVKTVIEELLYADGIECKLLKEAAMEFIIKNGNAVLESESYNLLDESPKLRKEVMKAFASRKK